MNKADLIQYISKEVGLTRYEANAAIDAFTGAIKKSLKKGKRVSLVGFGSWEVKKRKARYGVNPQTGAGPRQPRQMVLKRRTSVNPGIAVLQRHPKLKSPPS